MTDYPQQQDGFDSSEILRGLRRRAWIVALAILVVAGGAYMFSSRQPSEYKARTSLLVGDSAFVDNLLNNGNSAPQASDSDKQQQTRILQLKSPQVFAATAQRLGGGPGVAALNAIEVGADPKSNLVYITAQSPSQGAAALAANTFAAEAVVFRRKTDQARILQAQNLIGQQLKRVRASTPTDALTKKIRKKEIGKLQNQVQALDTLSHVQTGNVEVVGKAQVPTTPVSPRPKHDAAVGGFAGLLLGLALALIVEQRDRRMRRSNELETAFGMPLLGSVPISRALREYRGPGGQSQAPAEAEAFHMLRANLMHAGDHPGDLRSILVTSPGPDDGKSTVSFNLAAAAAVAGRRVLLIEADLRKPTLERRLALEATTGGLSTLLAHNGEAPDVRLRLSVGPPPVNGEPQAAMDVMVAGPQLGNPTQLIESDAMRQLIRAAEQEYDLVIIDSAPALLVSDAYPIISCVGGVVVVASMLGTTPDQAERLRKQLTRMHARTLGVVANFASAQDASYYGYETAHRG